MGIWKRLRMPLLIVTFANIVFVFGKTILFPPIVKETKTPFDFPEEVPLPTWQLVASDSLSHKNLSQPVVIRHYRYIQNQLPLDINMYYLLQTDGDVKRFISDRASIPLSLVQPSLVIRQHSGIGFYGIFVYQQQAYLDGCINSRGGSTFTAEQFNDNRMQYDLQLNRLLPYLLSEKPLRDRRCLWTHFSIPLNHASPESAYPILENAWFSWYHWWSSHFPEP
ncbi:MAG: hypothetical protein NVS2B14_20300 [Chamaesiphon sp.]